LCIKVYDKEEYFLLYKYFTDQVQFRQMASRIAQIASHLNYPTGLLAGQVAIITGSGQGIGAEAARLFANEGAKVVISDIDGGMARLCFLGTSILTWMQGKAKGIAEAINKHGGKAIAVPGDMLDSEYLKELVKKAAEFGNGRIHIIVNNAGWVF
jgi:3-oxoacyl-[acyl-carrier protein] reductase